jgi:hypothetical protein
LDARRQELLGAPERTTQSAVAATLGAGASLSRAEKKAREDLRRSRLVAELREEVSNLPVERLSGNVVADASGTAAAAALEVASDVQNYEEDNFLRMSKSRQKKELAKRLPGGGLKSAGAAGKHLHGDLGGAVSLEAELADFGVDADDLMGGRSKALAEVAEAWDAMEAGIDLSDDEGENGGNRPAPRVSDLDSALAAGVMGEDGVFRIPVQSGSKRTRPSADDEEITSEEDVLEDVSFRRSTAKRTQKPQAGPAPTAEELRVARGATVGRRGRGGRGGSGASNDERRPRQQKKALGKSKTRDERRGRSDAPKRERPSRQTRR